MSRPHCLNYIDNPILSGVVDRRSATLGEVLVGLAAAAIQHRRRDLSLTATSTLATVARSGPRRLTDLAASEGVTQPSMTAVVSQLEQLGLAERRRDPRDGRVVLVAITRAGRQHLRGRRRAGSVEFAVLIDKLPEPEAVQLAAALPALRHLLELAEDAKTAVPAPARPASTARRGTTLTR
jgi:DNA-binding MarR family transcriptional regulator